MLRPSRPMIRPLNLLTRDRNRHQRKLADKLASRALNGERGRPRSLAAERLLGLFEDDLRAGRGALREPSAQPGRAGCAAPRPARATGSPRRRLPAPRSAPRRLRDARPGSPHGPRSTFRDRSSYRDERRVAPHGGPSAARPPQARSRSAERPLRPRPRTSSAWLRADRRRSSCSVARGDQQVLARGGSRS